MITTKNLNAKAFQELVLYYLRERITHKNLEVKHLVATNINEWFIFDAILFDRVFAQNKNFVKQFTDFEAGRLADTKTDFFYKQIAEPFIDSIISEIEFTYFNIQDFQKPLRNTDKADDNSLIALFKLLSPEHLLKLPFTNDTNSLDKRFYSELLHIIGLTETKEGSKKLIGRNKAGERYTGTILEDAIIQLDSLDKISRLDKPTQFGSTKDERLFNVALELSITWINRILFLKLLEAQLITYHKGDKSYSFLNLDKIGCLGRVSCKGLAQTSPRWRALIARALTIQKFCCLGRVSCKGLAQTRTHESSLRDSCGTKIRCPPRVSLSVVEGQPCFSFGWSSATNQKLLSWASLL